MKGARRGNKRTAQQSVRTAKRSAPDLVGVAVRKRFVGYGMYDGVVEQMTGSVATVRWSDGTATTMPRDSVIKYRVDKRDGASAQKMNDAINESAQHGNKDETDKMQDKNENKSENKKENEDDNENENENENETESGSDADAEIEDEDDDEDDNEDDDESEDESDENGDEGGSDNDGSGARDAAAGTGEQLSAYERQRLRNLQRNAAIMLELGITQRAQQARAVARAEVQAARTAAVAQRGAVADQRRRRRQQRRAQKPAAVPQRRSKRVAGLDADGNKLPDDWDDRRMGLRRAGG